MLNAPTKKAAANLMLLTAFLPRIKELVTSYVEHRIDPNGCPTSDRASMADLVQAKGVSYFLLEAVQQQ